MRVVVWVCFVAGCATSEIGTDASPFDAAEAIGDAPPASDAPPVPDASLPDADSCLMGGTVDDCCGAVCPGIGAANAVPACEFSGCVFRCDGESYDVNGDIGDGCEHTDSPTGNHTTGGAIDLGSKPCDDGDSAIDVGGIILSDEREHTPAILGFRAASGHAPDQFRLEAGGGALCVNDVDLALTVTGSANASCYQLAVTTDVSTYTCNGNCRINPGASSYSDNTNIVFTVLKTCAADSLTERVTYTVSGHL